LARPNLKEVDISAPFRYLATGIIVFMLIALFFVWRLDNPRVEKLRAEVIDAILPKFEWVMAPATALIRIAQDFRSYQSLYEQNQELRRELQQMKSWKEAALQLEQENARLLDLNNLQLDPKLTHISSIVLADSGSPFRQSVLINVGLQDGIQDGWAAMDGLGLVGRISGVGSKTARVLLLTDTASIIPATIQPSGQQALIAGDNTIAPTIEFLENADLVRPGDRIETSGSGGIFPPNLLIGRLELDPSGRLRVRLSADYERLEFLRVLRNFGTEPINDPGKLIIHKSLKLLLDNESATASGL
jgi:rod shape-determining protein MreC